MILLYAAEGWDPLVQLFFYLGTTGGFGALVLAAATSIAVIVFFARDRRGESLWSAVIAPALSAAALVAMVWLVVDNYATLVGVAPGSALAWIFPGVFAVAAAAGIAWALIMKATRPRAYAAIGSGPGEK